MMDAPGTHMFQGYGLVTANITYRLPDHPSVLQVFVWQHLDFMPGYPRLNAFLQFWREKIDGALFRVEVSCAPRAGRTSVLVARDGGTLH